MIGKVIKSNAHYDYVCQIYQDGEVETPPAREDYQFGTFVRINLENGRYLIGLTYDTVLLNPEFGRLGPRLSNERELSLFTPDYLQEKCTLVGIVVIGARLANGHRQGVPRIAAKTDAPVIPLTPDQISGFHQPNTDFQLDYLPFLLHLNTPLARPLCLIVLEQMNRIFPERRPVINVLQQQFKWQTQINPFETG